jgi:DNA-binding beta-propeller fold protein YncE
MVVLLLAGCGSATIHELPPAAEPAHAPPLTETPAGRVIGLPDGAGAEGVAVDPASHVIAVGERVPPRLALVDPHTARARFVALGSPPRHLAFAGGRFLAPTEGDRRLVSVRADGRGVTRTPVGDHPHDATVLAGRAFVGDERGNTVTVVDGARRAATFRVATQPGGVAAADGGHALAVVSVRERVLELYDPQTLRRLARAPAGVGPTHVVAEADRLYVADTQGGALLVFATHPKLELVRRVDLPGGPYGIAIDPVRHRLWVTLTARNELVSLPANGRPRVILRLPTVRQPNSVAVDSAAGTVAVVGRAAGALELIGARDAYPEQHP